MASAGTNFIQFRYRQERSKTGCMSDTGRRRQCPGSRPWATWAKGKMPLLWCSSWASVPKWLAAWTWLLSRQLVALPWPKLNIPWLSRQLTVRWLLAQPVPQAPCCLKMLACHLVILELEEQVLSLRDVIYYLIYLAAALLLLIFLHWELVVSLMS